MDKSSLFRIGCGVASSIAWVLLVSSIFGLLFGVVIELWMSIIAISVSFVLLSIIGFILIRRYRYRDTENDDEMFIEILSLIVYSIIGILAGIMFLVGIS